jgi:hypothetical protein
MILEGFTGVEGFGITVKLFCEEWIEEQDRYRKLRIRPQHIKTGAFRDPVMAFSQVSLVCETICHFAVYD